MMREKFSDMKKETKIIIGVLVVLVIVIAVVVCTNILQDDKNSNSKEKNTTNAVTEAISEKENITVSDEELVNEEESIAKEIWENIEVYEGGDGANNNGETVTDADGNVVEAYPGKDEGWSPVVPADDVGNNE